MTISEAIAEVFDRGHEMSEIRKMTRWQVRNIAFHPRNKDGSIRRRAQAARRPDRLRERFDFYRLERNLPRHVAMAKARADMEGRDA